MATLFFKSYIPRFFFFATVPSRLIISKKREKEAALLDSSYKVIYCPLSCWDRGEEEEEAARGPSFPFYSAP